MSTTSATSTSLAIDGLVSGLKTSELINSLMSIEQVPQTLLKAKVTTTNSFISSLQTINGLVQSLATKASAAAKAGSLDLYTATSSATNATVSTSAAATPGSVSFTVGQTAAAQVGVTAAMSSWGGHRVAADVHEARRHDHDGHAEDGLARRHRDGDQRLHRRGHRDEGRRRHRRRRHEALPPATDEHRHRRGERLHPAPGGPPPTSRPGPRRTCSPRPAPPS
ncbi:flagellar cap protein FliD N-terminal domain-containing protein [Curtobacterium sp. MCJR17_043]|uniref:flagellar cap protein FliD N-terminal domain-containing protein n=1 Tax=Curtobacterium sp. MCJR17_043 TaxID=2175660 RepID=UPI0024E00BFD|nr:flagellar cap protein FliD N-terminal domain-containing protein [Curtobacterium sp. MCJR17_043]WIB34913.1 flagellar cap protein FliD N-terminal domain-containing protein [Curtobacterium sp. MCJR17_043]